jgi:hypothetical protein
MIVTAIGAVVRFWDLGYASDGGTPIFDEKYYALNAAEMLRLGGIEENPAFGVVVHPPLGKQLIAIGEWLFGYNSFGWRFASAIAGTLCILLIIRIARRLTGSTLLGGIAGILLICDGVSHVNARTALLDVFTEVFVLGGRPAPAARDGAPRPAALAVVIRGDRHRHLHGHLVGLVPQRIRVAAARPDWPDGGNLEGRQRRAEWRHLAQARQPLGQCLLAMDLADVGLPLHPALARVPRGG